MWERRGSAPSHVFSPCRRATPLFHPHPRIKYGAGFSLSCPQERGENNREGLAKEGGHRGMDLLMGKNGDWIPTYAGMTFDNSPSCPSLRRREANLFEREEPKERDKKGRGFT